MAKARSRAIQTGTFGSFGSKSLVIPPQSAPNSSSAAFQSNSQNMGPPKSTAQLGSDLARFAHQVGSQNYLASLGLQQPGIQSRQNRTLRLPETLARPQA